MASIPIRLEAIAIRLDAKSHSCWVPSSFLLLLVRHLFLLGSLCYSFLIPNGTNGTRTQAWSPRAIRINGWRYSGMLEADLVARAVCSGFIHVLLGFDCF